MQGMFAVPWSLLVLVVLVVLVVVSLVFGFWLQKKRSKQSKECGDCIHFDEFVKGGHPETHGRGFCRRNPPTGAITYVGDKLGVFPTVYYSDSCSEFDYKE